MREEEVDMRTAAYEATTTAARWLPTPIAPRLTQRQVAATPKWLVVATPAVLALAGLTAWFFRERRFLSGSPKVKDVMISDVVTIAASATLAEAARLMRDSNVGVLPVVGKETIVGVITDRDLVVRALAEGADPTLTVVGEFASVDPICARPDTPVDEAMEVMATCQVGRLPVVDYDNRLVGIVTLSSLALRSREETEALHTAQEVARRSARAA
jgi:CBS domain-containing protein